MQRGTSFLDAYGTYNLATRYALNRELIVYKFMDVKELIEDVLMDLADNKTLIDVSSKIQIIVRLLGDDKLKTWYTREFVTGYKDEELPDYRISSAADIKATYLMPHGFGNMMHVSGQSVPVANLGIEKYKEIMAISFKDTISAIINYSNHLGNLAMSLSPYEKVQVQKVLGDAQIQNVYKVIPPSSYQTIIDSVKGRIIDLFMDLNEKVFDGGLDINSKSVKEEIRQVITNNITAGIVQTGSGVIETTNSTISTRIEQPLSSKTISKLFSLVNEIEEASKRSDKPLDEIEQDIAELKSELSSIKPRPSFLKKTLKSIAWGASIIGETVIGELVKTAITWL